MYCGNKSIVFYNGEFVNANDLKVSGYSQTLHYGNGVFEGMRAYKTPNGSRIFKPIEHFERLKFGADTMDIAFNYSSEELTNITYELLQKNNLEDAYIRPLITTGADMSLLTSKETNFIIQCWEWGKYMGDNLLKVKTSKFQRPNPRSCIVEAKVTGHYVNSILATNDAKKSGFDEALLLDMNKNVAECSGANVFMEKGGKLFTPPKGHIMPGITRSTIIDICREEGIPVEETHFTIDVLKSADSAFFTGTAAEVVGLQSIDDYHFPMDWDKTLGYRLMHLYKEEVLGFRKSKLSKTG